MSTMTISLPDDLKSFVDSQVAGRGYRNSSEYLRELIRKEQDRVRFRQLILDGMASELNETPLDKKYFEELRNRARARRQ